MSAELEILLPDTLDYVACNLCGAEDTQELYPAAERRNGHGTSSELYTCTSNAYGICGPIVKCRRCGLVYQNPIPSSDEIIEAYDGVVDRRYEEERSGRIETFSRDLAAVVPREGLLALPKGHPDEGESLEQAATREVLEETGLVADPVGKLGEVRYWYTLAGERVLKVVTFFLFAYRSGSLEDHDDEVESAAWVPLEQAPELLSYKGERQMAEKAVALQRERNPSGG